MKDIWGRSYNWYPCEQTGYTDEKHGTLKMDLIIEREIELVRNMKYILKREKRKLKLVVSVFQSLLK